MNDGGTQLVNLQKISNLSPGSLALYQILCTGNRSEDIRGRNGWPNTIGVLVMGGAADSVCEMQGIVVSVCETRLCEA